MSFTTLFGLQSSWATTALGPPCHPSCRLGGVLRAGEALFLGLIGLVVLGRVVVDDLRGLGLVRLDRTVGGVTASRV